MLLVWVVLQLYIAGFRHLTAAALTMYVIMEVDLRHMYSLLGRLLISSIFGTPVLCRPNIWVRHIFGKSPFLKSSSTTLSYVFVFLRAHIGRRAVPICQFFVPPQPPECRVLRWFHPITLTSDNLVYVHIGDGSARALLGAPLVVGVHLLAPLSFCLHGLTTFYTIVESIVGNLCKTTKLMY